MMLSLLSRAAALVIILSIFAHANGGKLLVVPMDGSHWLSMRPVAERLAQNGHKVVVLTSESSLTMDGSDLYTTISYSVPYSKQDLVFHVEKFGGDHFIPSSFPGVTITMLNNMHETFRIFGNICRGLLSDSELIQNLKDEKFDALLTDPFSMCGAILAEHLDVPTVNFLRGMPCTFDYISAQCPNPLSYVPRIFSQYLDKMTFAQRVKNVLVRMLEPFYCGYSYSSWLQIASDFLKKDVTVEQLLSRTSIWLLRYDFVFEFPRPIMPNMVFIGGINCKPEKPLTKVRLIIVNIVYNYWKNYLSAHDILY